MNKSLILVVEDEQSIAEVIVAYLQRSGYQTKHLATGLEVESFIATNAVSLIILDLMLPDCDGITICKNIRQYSPIPIIMATAKVDEIDRLLGLEIGADDYICKPFSTRELVARVKAILRRFPENAKDQYIVGSLLLEDKKYLATVNHQPLELTRREYQLLTLLAHHPNQVFSRDQIIGNLYEDTAISDRTIDSHVKNIRKKLKQKVSGQEWISAVYGVGYKFHI